jgi:hypothetical protein
MMSLPLVNSPKRENGGLVRELSTGTLTSILAEAIFAPPASTGLDFVIR